MVTWRWDGRSHQMHLDYSCPALDQLLVAIPSANDTGHNAHPDMAAQAVASTLLAVLDNCFICQEVCKALLQPCYEQGVMYWKLLNSSLE